MTFLITILTFSIVISILVFVHELGHFLAAKRAGMKVEEFAIGFKPAIFQKKVGETNYVVGAIPIGGYVKIFGENPGSEKEKALEIKDNKKREEKLLEIERDENKTFGSKNRFWQAIVLSMGVIFNFIFAYLVILFMIFSGPNVSMFDIQKNDKDYVVEKKLIIADVQKDSQAQKSNISKGSEIIYLEVDGKKENIFSEKLLEAIRGSKENIKVSYLENKILTKAERDSWERGTLLLEFEKVILPVTYNEDGEKEKFGIYFSQEGKLKLPFLKNFQYAWKSFVAYFEMTWDGFKQLFSGKVSIDDISGPVGIAKISGQAAENGLNSVLTLLAILSINLGIINILPFPALDGGRLLIVIIESIRRKNISKKIVNYINFLGMIILLLFMLFITYKDILKIFQ